MHNMPADSCRGFSLVELMIVLAVMSLLLMFAAPRMAGNLTGLTLKTAAKKTAGMVRYARSQAVATGVPHAAVFDCERQTVIVAALTRPAERGLPAGEGAGDAEESPEPAPRREVKMYALPEDVRIDIVSVGGAECNRSGDIAICQMVFYADGTTQGGAVTIVDAKERRYDIAVDFLTGCVTLEEQERRT